MSCYFRQMALAEKWAATLRAKNTENISKNLRKIGVAGPFWILDTKARLLFQLMNKQYHSFFSFTDNKPHSFVLSKFSVQLKELIPWPRDLFETDVHHKLLS